MRAWKPAQTLALSSHFYVIPDPKNWPGSHLLVGKKKRLAQLDEKRLKQTVQGRRVPQHLFAVVK